MYTEWLTVERSGCWFLVRDDDDDDDDSCTYVSLCYFLLNSQALTLHRGCEQTRVVVRWRRRRQCERREDAVCVDGDSDYEGGTGRRLVVGREQTGYRVVADLRRVHQRRRRSRRRRGDPSRQRGRRGSKGVQFLVAGVLAATRQRIHQRQSRSFNTAVCSTVVRRPSH